MPSTTCSKCGKMLPENYRFCDNCGTKVGAAPRYNFGGPPAPLPPVDPANLTFSTPPRNDAAFGWRLVAFTAICAVTLLAGLFFWRVDGGDTETPQETRESAISEPSPANAVSDPAVQDEYIYVGRSSRGYSRRRTSSGGRRHYSPKYGR